MIRSSERIPTHCISLSFYRKKGGAEAPPFFVSALVNRGYNKSKSEIGDCKKSEKTFDKPDRQVYNTVEHE